MNLVQPLRSKREINIMKKALGNPRDKLLFIIGINSALRISDILKLKVGDARNRDILIQEQKTGKVKKFRLNKSIIEAVNTLVPPDAKEDEWLFPSRKFNKPISRVQAWRILNDAAARAGLKTEIGTHTLRKTFAYHAYKSGVDLSILMSVLNHSSQRDTLRYIGIEQDQLDDVYISVNL